MNPAENIKPGTIVQVSPEAADMHPTFSGCLAIVEENRPWGVVAYVLVPKGDNLPGQAFLRLPWRSFRICGAAAWTIAPSEPEEPAA